MRKRTVRAGISLGVVFAVPATAQAEELRVTNLNDSGAGSLREAINDASADTDADRIVFKSKLSGRIDLHDAPLHVVRGDLDIRGPGARKVTVDGNDETRVLQALEGTQGLYPEIDVRISGLTITGGTGGGIGSFESDQGGGLLTFGDVDMTLSQVTVSGNTVDGAGGGVASVDSDLEIQSTTITDNLARGDVVGIFGGGGIHAGTGTALTVRNSTVSGNASLTGANASAGDGAGIYVGSPASTVIRHTTIADNLGEGDGGWPVRIHPHRRRRDDHFRQLHRWRGK